MSNVEITYILIGLLTFVFLIMAVRTVVAFWILLPLENQISSHIYTAAYEGMEQWMQGYSDPKRNEYISGGQAFQKGFWACSSLSAFAIVWGCIATLAIWASIGSPDLGNALWGLLPPCLVLSYFGRKLWHLQRAHKKLN